MTRVIGSLLAIIFISFLTGLLFLWSGIAGTLMIEAMTTDGVIRTFTYYGLGLGGVLGVIATWLHEKGKRDGI